MAQQIVINKAKNEQKWFPVIEKLGVTDSSKKEWLAEYAQMHQINESTAYATLGNLSGMGAITAPQVGATPGDVAGGTVGSGDYGQQLLPIAMKVAAHTIGLDLVAVKPSAGPVIDLMYVDYRYDDKDASSADNYNPITFKISGTDTLGNSYINELTSRIRIIMTQLNVREIQGGLNQRMFFNLASNATSLGLAGYPGSPTINGSSEIRAKGAIGANLGDVLSEPTGSKEGVIEFLGFSRVDKSPMFKAYRTTNVANTGVWRFDRTKNTFGEVENVVDAFNLYNGSTQVLSNNTIGFGTSGTLSTAGINVGLISALEDHIFGFSSSNGLHSMARQDDEKFYPGIIAPNVTTKRVQVGTITVSSALKLTEIEDIKAQTGIDIVSKLESVLVNELSQNISKEIVNKIFEMGDLNRKSAPGYDGTVSNGGTTMFDFDVQRSLGIGTGLGQVAPGGETKQSLQRGLITKVKIASNFISTEGRVGPATYLVTNGALAAVLTEGANYELNKESGSSSAPGQLYPAGKVAGLTIYVDPYMLYNDSRIVLGRKNNPDQPGIIFIPYLMAQSVKLISEATFAPRLMLRSRYAVADLGFFPQKQYITLYVNDPQYYLS